MKFITNYVIFLFIICFQLSYISSSLSRSKYYQDFLSFTQTTSRLSSKLQKSSSHQTFQPISLDEFEYRITSFLLKEVKHEKPSVMSNDKLGNFENAFRYNKMYRCLFGKNLIYSTKILFHLIRIKIRQCERVLQKAEIDVRLMRNNLLDLKSIIRDIMSVGQNIMCHKEITNVEIRVDQNIEAVFKKFREIKNAILENLLDFCLNTIKRHFSRYEENLKNPIEIPEEFNQSVRVIKRYWIENFQDMDYFKKTLELIIIGMRRVMSGKFDDNENIKKWGKYFGKFAYEFFKLKHVILNESPSITIKKESASFYYGARILLQKLENYYTQDLGNEDNEMIVRMSRQFVEVVCSHYLVSSAWPVFFQENEFVMSEIPTQYNFKDPFMKIYEKSGLADINYRTCSEINEMEEILLVNQRITESLNEISFTYDIEHITNLLDYKPALDNIYEDVCMTEPDMCLDVLFDRKTIQNFAKVILKIDSSFNKKLVGLRKFGPITNIGISQNVFEENYYIKMGYVAPYQTNDKSLMLWVCRSCGGDYAISSIAFQQGKIKDFSSILPNPTKAFNIFQIFEDLVLIAESVMMDTTPPSPLYQGNQKETFLSSMIYDDDRNSTEIWVNLGYNNTKTGFFLLFNEWDVSTHKWSTVNYPKIFNTQWSLENRCFCVITIGNSSCKQEMIAKFGRSLMYEDQFDEYLLWTYRTEKKDINISELQETIKAYDCQLLNIFETKPNGNFALIDEENKEGLIKDQLQGDRKAMDLYFERVPQKNLYICYQWLYPMEESLEIDFQSLSLTHVKHILRTNLQDKLTFYKDVLCDPTSRRFCSFIDDDYLKKRNYLDVHIIGVTASFPVLSSELNYAKILRLITPPLPSNPIVSKCNQYYQNLPNIQPLQINDIDTKLLNIIITDFPSIANEHCEISKVYPLQIPCPNRLKFIHQTGKYSINYLCSENMDEVEGKLHPEERIPIDRNIYLYVKITETPMDKIDFDDEKIKELNYYFMAYWVRFDIIPFINKNNRLFYLLTMILIRINVHHYNFIGLADTYSKSSCIDLNNNYDRYNSIEASKFQKDSFLYRHEKAFFNSIKPRKLEFYEQKYNLGTFLTNNWKIFLKKTQCEYSRIWIPITWKGDGGATCSNVFSVKSLKILPNVGIKETCDGTKLPIYNVYYLEVLAYTDPTNPGFKQPNPIDLDIASKHGYVPYGNKLQTYSVIEGYHTKVRLWVKPKAKINSLRKIICREISGNENNTPTPYPPINFEKDVYSRVTVLSNEAEKTPDDC